MTLGIRVAAGMLLIASVAGPAFAQESGAANYKAKCVMCHGADGLATSPVAKSMKVLSFKAPEMVKASDAQLVASVKNGKGKMPAYHGRLTDEEIKGVISYVRTLQK